MNNEKIHNAVNINDKQFAPFLLAASFQGLVYFIESNRQNGILYWKFSPKDEAEELINQFRTKTEPHIPAKDLFEAIDTWWKEVAEMKGKKQYAI